MSCGFKIFIIICLDPPCASRWMCFILGTGTGVTVLPVVNQPATLKTGLRVPARVMLRTVTPIPKKPAMRGMTSGSSMEDSGEPANFGER